MSAQQRTSNFNSPLRYPGGKGALSNFVKIIISQNNLFDGDYIEVYAGGAGIAWNLLFEEYVQKIHINDLSKPIHSFWKSALEQPDELCKLIMDTPVTMEQWYQQKKVTISPENHTYLELGYATFFLNRTNRSGILKGGVIGGKDQTGNWKIDARFNKRELVQRIQRIARYSNRINLYNLDAAEFIQNNLPKLPEKSLIYLDPPYFQKGYRLYENYYNPESHKNISHLISTIKQPWLVSYDDCPEINDLYQQFQKIRYQISYSARSRYEGSEVIFYSNSLSVPEYLTNPLKVKSTAYMKTLL